MCDASEEADFSGDDDNWSPAYHRCELLDSSRAEGDFEQALAPAFAFIDAALAVERGKGGAVLIHCCAGRSRGPAVMTAYLIHRYRWSLDKAFTFVCQARPVVCPNRGFLSALLKLEKRLLGANTMCLRHNGHHHTLVSLRHSSK
jgi:dual specificity MAP kinase phosphatase